MFDSRDTTPLDAPLFPEGGRSAAAVFRTLSPALPAELWTTGNLLPPNSSESRTEFKLHVTEHREMQREGMVWLALRLDPIDLGRLLYRGETPLEGEPSWRELGAVALERAIQILAAVSGTDEHTKPPGWAHLCQDVNLSGRLSGLRFGHSALLSEPDYRFSFLELSWVGTVKHPMSSPIAQTLVIHELCAELQKELPYLKGTALSRYPVGHFLRHEEYPELSHEELEMMGANAVEYDALRALEQDTRIPDVIPVTREGFESRAAPPLVPQIDEASNRDSVPNLIDELQAEDVNRFKMQLASAGIGVAGDHASSDPASIHSVERSESGVKVFLELDVRDGESGLEIAKVFENGLHAEVVATGLAGSLDLKFSRLLELHRKERWFSEINLQLPRSSPQNDPIRSARLAILARALIDHRDLLR